MASSKIMLDRVLYVKYQHPNVANAHKFLLDFGFVAVQESPERIYYRGFGKDQYAYICEKSPDDRRHFDGGAWVVQSMADLEAASSLPGASNIGTLDAPGGGNVVTVPDPVGGVVTLVYGQEERAHDKPKPVIWNTWEEKHRLGEFQRPDIGPSKVHKLGHYGFEVNSAEFSKVLKWYLDTFNLLPTDSLYNPESGQDVMTFIHVDKGEEFTDHHSIFIAAGSVEPGQYRAHHSSFEVDDMDSELVGHDWLQKKGWTNCWGVGRHLLGSQIFDYWFDSSGFVLEHYSDGDLVNRNYKPTKEVAAPDTISVWGPNVPLAFLTRKMEDIPASGNNPLPLEV